MKIGMNLPVMVPGLNRDRILEWSRRIDAGPYASLAAGERITFPNPEVMVTLSAAAAVTERVQITFCVLVLPMHNAVRIAKQVATLDVISAGRVTLGVGVGGREEDYVAVGAEYDKRLWGRMEEQVAIMRRAWAGEAVVEGALRPVEPAPIQDGWPGAAGRLDVPPLDPSGRALGGRDLGLQLRTDRGGGGQPVRSRAQRLEAAGPRLGAPAGHQLLVRPGRAGARPARRLSAPLPELHGSRGRPEAGSDGHHHLGERSRRRRSDGARPRLRRADPRAHHLRPRRSGPRRRPSRVGRDWRLATPGLREASNRRARRRGWRSRRSAPPAGTSSGSLPPRRSRSAGRS